MNDISTYPSSLVIHPPDYQEEAIEPVNPVDLPRDVAVIRRRPAWLRDTFQDALGHVAPCDTFRESKRP